MQKSCVGVGRWNANRALRSEPGSRDTQAGELNLLSLKKGLQGKSDLYFFPYLTFWFCPSASLQLFPLWICLMVWPDFLQELDQSSTVVWLQERWFSLICKKRDGGSQRDWIQTLSAVNQLYISKAFQEHVLLLLCWNENERQTFTYSAFQTAVVGK